MGDAKAGTGGAIGGGERGRCPECVRVWRGSGQGNGLQVLPPILFLVWNVRHLFQAVGPKLNHLL
jgi:hypothetical protein